MNAPIYTAYLKGSLKLSKFGEWWHNGVAFQNQKLSALFHRSIIWSEDEKSYFVKIGNNRASFDIEDTPYFVLELQDQVSPWRVLLSDENIEELDLSTLRVGSEDQIYCLVKAGLHQARFSRSAYQALITHAQDEQSLLVEGKRVPLARKS